ncbi:ABC transporter permease [Neorhizobium lilium]|uniref:ABC transporter permease n=1 Tax=Neorhizobium lilium TaxID=2503024 RepID=A0A3S3T3S8_9HYPH|nr:ABC transporter permease [Neorhizobium lilium]RWX81435.1 ABC transporter permease [Neorhizobium lilium]
MLIVLDAARRLGGDVALACFVCIVLLFLVTPTLIVIPMAFGEADYIEFPPRGFSLEWFDRYLTDPDWIDATLFSLKIAAGAMVGATLIGTAASVALARSRLPGASLLFALTLSPLVLPHIVLAIALYLAFAPLQLVGTTTGFLLAHTMLGVPYVTITVSAALRGFDPMLELAALNCGASRTRAFFDVVLPSIWPGITAGAIFAFLASFDEATVSLFISDVGGKTLTRKFFEDIDFNLTPVIAAVSTIMLAVSVVTMAAAAIVKKRQVPATTEEDITA